MKTYIAFLRGINVGGNHKLPMKDLKTLMKQNGFENIVTLLNSGNIIFDAETDSSEKIERELSLLLEKEFGFVVPTVVKTKEDILQMHRTNSFKNIETHKDLKLYVSFLYEKLANQDLNTLEDKAFTILKIDDSEIYSTLNITKGRTTKAMEKMDKLFERKLTTRNWNTIEKIVSKLN